MYNWAFDRTEIQSEPLDLSIKSFLRDSKNLDYTKSYYQSHDSSKEESYGATLYDKREKRSNCVNFPYIVGVVDKLSSSFSDLSKSISGSGKNVLPCHVCFKSFDRPSLLKRHLRTHTGEKPHVCPVCDKGFSTSSSLNTHKRIHTGEKPHRCPECGKCFTASSNLYYHRMTHTKNKPHKCTLCPRSFPTPGELRAHRPAHGGAWPHACPLCARGFAKHANLRHHMRLHGAGSMLPFYPMETSGITSVLKSLRLLKEGSHNREIHEEEDDQDTFQKDISSKTYFRAY